MKKILENINRKAKEKKTQSPRVQVAGRITAVQVAGRITAVENNTN
jgi:hypothetical protein